MNFFEKIIRGAPKKYTLPEGVYGDEARDHMLQYHPELQNMALGEIRFVESAKPLVKNESKYLEIDTAHQYQALDVWENEPDRSKIIGSGSGFSEVLETPVFIRQGAVKVPDIYVHGSFIVISRRALDVLKEFDQEALTYITIERHAKRVSIDGEYYLLDIIRMIPSIDYFNSHLRAEYRESKYIASEVSLGLGNGYRIRADIDPSIHIFRDCRYRSTIFVSRELAVAIRKENLTGVYFSDPAGALAINSGETHDSAAILNLYRRGQKK